MVYDGVVRQVESDEYCEITNTGGAAVNLAGWRLNAGDPGQDFIFPNKGDCGHLYNAAGEQVSEWCY